MEYSSLNTHIAIKCGVALRLPVWLSAVPTQHSRVGTTPQLQRPLKEHHESERRATASNTHC